MRISVTGTWTSSRRPATGFTATGFTATGFTLIEILVVVVIIGVLAAGVLLSVGVAGTDRQMETERDRLSALLDYVREQAALQNREFGLRVHAGGYEFVAYEPDTALWERVVGEKVLRERKLPAGLEVTLFVDGRPVILPQADSKDLTPQVLLFSSGDMSLFEITVRRTGTKSGFILAPAANEDRIELKSLAAATP
ncbi:MAG: type II secretion system minor pseudopilin GspH [Pseudomonadota bacterium]